MNLSLKANRSRAIAGTAAVLAVAAMGFAGAAQARDNVTFSVGVGLPGVAVGVTNAYPVYAQPVYVQPAPVYVEPAPVYYQPQPVYVQPRVYYGAPPVVYVPPGRRYGWYKHHGHGDHDDDRDGRFYPQAYAPVYYQR